MFIERNMGSLIMNTHFGFGDPVRTQTGPVQRREIDTAIEAFVPPTGYGEARDLLLLNRLVILEGEPDSGKSCLALNLLHECAPERAFQRLAPSTPWADLAGHRFQPGMAYLLADHAEVADSRRAYGDACFHVGRLREAIASSDSWLVVTRGRQETYGCQDEIPVVEVVAPHAAQIVAAHEEHHETTLPEAARARLLEALASSPQPRRIVEVISRVLKEPERAQAIIEELDASHSAVADFLDPLPGPEELAIVTTLAFVPGLEKRRFEAIAEQLVEQMDLTAGRRRRAGRGGVPRNCLHTCPLITLKHHDDHGVRTTTVEPRYPDATETLLRELWDRYGRQLWSPVERWLEDVVDASDEYLENDVSLCLRLGASLATLSRFAYREVVDRYVDGWACRGDSRWWVAVFTLAHLDQPPGVARDRAVRWVQGEDDSLAVTAMVALAVRIGCGYPFDSLNALWRYGARGDEEELALSNTLIAVQFATMVREKANPTEVFRFLRARTVSSRKTRYPVLRERPYRLALELLSLRPSVNAPMCCAQLLHDAPGAAHELVRLLQCLFVRTKSRTPTVRALTDLLDDIAYHYGSSDIHQQIATALNEHLTPEESTLLRRDLVMALSHRDRARTDYTGSYEAFLTLLAS